MSTLTIRELRTRRRESPGGFVECVTAWRSRGQDFRFFFKETNNFKSTSGWFSRGRSERKRSKLWASSSRAGIFCFTLFFVTIGPFYSLRQTVTHVAPPSRTRLVVSTKKEKMRTHARSKGPLIEHYITMRSPIVCCACTLVGTTPRGASSRTNWNHPTLFGSTDHTRVISWRFTSRAAPFPDACPLCNQIPRRVMTERSVRTSTHRHTIPRRGAGRAGAALGSKTFGCFESESRRRLINCR